jgi:PAS domain S-box-containing protein
MKKGVIIRVNPSAERLFGYESEALTGQKIELLVQKRFSGRHVQHRTDYAQNPHARAMGSEMELYGLRKDGTEFSIKLILSSYANKEGTFVIAFIVDITLRKQTEERLRNYSEDLENRSKAGRLFWKKRSKNSKRPNRS